MSLAVARHALVEMTKRCNCRCPHCFTGGGEPGAEPELAGENLADIINALGQVGIRHVTLSGGELALRSDLVHLLRCLHPGTSVVIFSNGLLMQYPERLRLVDDFIQEYATSLDHIDERHDGFRMYPGLFRLTVKLIQHAKAKGKAVYVQTMVMPANWGDLDETVAFIAALGVDELRLSHVGPQGRALRHPELHLPPRLYPKLQQRASGYGRRYGLRVITNLMDRALIAECPELFPRPTLHILPHGQVLPWFGLHPAWSLGMVTSGSDVERLLDRFNQSARHGRVAQLFSQAREASLRFPHAAVPVDDILLQTAEQMTGETRRCPDPT